MRSLSLTFVAVLLLGACGGGGNSETEAFMKDTLSYLEDLSAVLDDASAGGDAQAILLRVRALDRRGEALARRKDQAFAKVRDKEFDKLTAKYHKRTKAALEAMNISSRRFRESRRATNEVRRAIDRLGPVR